MGVKDILFVRDNIHDDVDYIDICKNMQNFYIYLYNLYLLIVFFK